MSWFQTVVAVPWYSGQIAAYITAVAMLFALSVSLIYTGVEISLSKSLKVYGGVHTCVDLRRPLGRGLDGCVPVRDRRGRSSNRCET